MNALRKALLCAGVGTVLGYVGMIGLVYVASDPRLQPQGPVSMPLDKYRCPQGPEFTLCRITSKEPRP